LVGEARRCHTDALKCTQRREEEVGKGKAWGLETPLGRAEMHAEAFAQVTAVWCLVCSSAVRWRSALGASSHRCSALRFCSLPVTAQRSRFLGEQLGGVRFVLISSFR